MAEPPDAMPFNALKPLEHGLDNGHAPTQGVHVELPLHGPLDRVRVDSQRRALTTRQGVTVSDNQHALKAGLRGPTLPEDFILRDKLTHFDHERIPERVVHARGAGAHGHFEACESLADLTMADPFAQAGQRTPVFVRSSTVAGERGSADTVRDTRGFAVKFYTRAGTHSLVWDEAVRIAGTEADFHRRDLWEAIEAGHAPAYELALQAFTDPQAAARTRAAARVSAACRRASSMPVTMRWPCSSRRWAATGSTSANVRPGCEPHVCCRAICRGP